MTVEEEQKEETQMNFDETKEEVDAEKAEGVEEDGTETATEKKKVKLVPADAPWSARMWEVFSTFWPLGLVAFGGPQAHVAILRDHLVEQRQWMDEEEFTELFAIGQGIRLCFDFFFKKVLYQIPNVLLLFSILGLPGPTSTQLVISTALSRAGPLGGLMAFFLWNLPGLIVLTACGVLLAEFIPDPDDP